MLQFVSRLLGEVKHVLPMIEATYKDLHQNPELPLQETRTAGIVAQKLREAGYEVTEKIGKTGVVGIMKNGDGPTVMLRADMDALPMKEDTGVPYASTKEGVNAKGETVPVAHSCGHDMHTSWLLGAATVLSQAREAWHGTLMTVLSSVSRGRWLSYRIVRQRLPSCRRRTCGIRWRQRGAFSIRVLAALGACTGMTLRMYARSKGWPLEDVVVRLSHQKVHATDCRDCNEQDRRIDSIELELELEFHGELEEAQRQRLLEIAGRCPVHRTLTGEVRIGTVLRAGQPYGAGLPV